PFLDPVAKGDPVPCEPELRRIVVRGDERTGGQRLAAELRHREAVTGRELDLTLNRLPHRRSVSRLSVRRCLRSVNVRAASVKISLTPRTSEFYELFARAGENALDVARLVERRFHEHPNSGVTQEQVKAAETAGDQITHDLIQLLNTQYLTPFDREDIYQ